MSRLEKIGGLLVEGYVDVTDAVMLVPPPLSEGVAEKDLALPRRAARERVSYRSPLRFVPPSQLVGR
jgi:hypothetical protein